MIGRTPSSQVLLSLSSLSAHAGVATSGTPRMTACNNRRADIGLSLAQKAGILSGPPARDKRRGRFMLPLNRMRRTPLLVLAIASLALPPDPSAAASSRRSPQKRRTATTKVVLPDLIAPPRPSARDLDVAEACRRALGSTAGAVVAIDPWSGRVLAVVNPREALVKAYTPCSVFKIVVAVAGLSEGIITP